MEDWIDRFHGCGGRSRRNKREGELLLILSLNEILLIDVVDFFALCAEEEDDGSNTSLSIHLQQEQRSG